MFDLRLLSLFGIFLGFEQTSIHRATALTKVGEAAASCTAYEMKRWGPAAESDSGRNIFLHRGCLFPSVILLNLWKGNSS